MHDSDSHSRVVLATALACLTLMFLVVSREPEPEHPEWAVVTKELEGSAWPLVTSARYDAVNHFVLVDLRPDVTIDAAQRLACEGLRPRFEQVDATVGFALYQAPDRVVAHGGDCAADA